MKNIQDLNLEKEILPLFDFTLNNFSKSVLVKLLNEPLVTKNKIVEKQDILKGFLENYDILNNYSYSPLYLNEVYPFILLIDTIS